MIWESEECWDLSNAMKSSAIFVIAYLYDWSLNQAVNPQPTMEDANSMFDVLDDNKDKVVSESDF